MRFIACLLITLLSASASSLALADWVDYSSNVELKHSTPKFNRATRQYDVVVSITNTSEQVIGGNQRLLVSRPSLPLLSEDGQTESGTPFVSLAPEQLAPSQTIQVSLSFALRRARLTFSSSFEVEPAASLEFTSDSSVEVAENASGQVYRPSAEGQDVSFALAAEFDSDAFNYVSETNTLSFAALPDFESPADSDKDNVYTVKFIATDGQGNKAEQVVTVTVTDESQLEGVISFPTDGGDFGGGLTQTSVSGYIVDHEDGLVLPSDVANVKVNGINATIVAGERAQWHATVPIALEAPTSIALSFNDALGNQSTNQVTVSNSFLSRVKFPQAIELDETNNRALIVDSAAKALVAVDFSSGELTIVSDKYSHSVPNMLQPRGIAISGNRVAISDAGLDSIVEVDLSTGNRILFTPEASEAGPSLAAPEDVIFDSQNNLLVSDPSLRAVLRINSAAEATTLSGRDFSIDPATGRPRRTEVGAGTSRLRPRGLALSQDGELAYWTHGPSFGAGLISTNTATGEVNVVSDSTDENQGISLNFPRKVVIDVTENRALVVDTGLDAIVAINLDSGFRSIFYQGDPELGTHLSFPTDLVLTADGRSVYILDSGDRKIVEVDLKSGDGRLLTQYGNHTAQLFQSPRDIIFDEQNQRLLILDRGDAVISSLNVVTGQTEVITSATVGSGINFETPLSMAFDQTNGRLFVVDGALRAVISVSVKTGERKVIRQRDLGDDDFLFSPSQAIDYDPQTDRVLIYSSVNDGGVFAIDPITGSGNYTANAEDSVFIGIDGSSVLDKSSQRLLLTTSRGVAAIGLANGMTELLSSRSIGAGVEYGSLRGIALDQNNNRVILTDIILDALIEVDLETGDRRIIADANTGSGVDLSAPLNLRLDLKNNIAYVVDSILGGIIAVNLATGDRIILAD